MNLYSNKQKWKIVLMIVALCLVGASLFVSNRIVAKVSKREKERVTQWADAIKKRAELVKLTNRSFEELRDKERNEMELWIEATKEVSQNISIGTSMSYDLPLRIINANNKIPVIVLDQNRNYSQSRNVSLSKEDILVQFPRLNPKEAKEKLEDSLAKLALSWEKVNPSFTVEIYEDLYMTYYFNESLNITRLQNERDSLIQSFNDELIDNSDFVPVVLVNENQDSIIAHNLSGDLLDTLHAEQDMSKLGFSNKPLEISFAENELNYVYYDDSQELKQLQYFPYIQFLIIGLFIFIGYLIFSTFRKAEQNQVWAGMAKETAHQLGTPLSSLMAWIQLLETMDVDDNIPEEMNKDIKRLTQVTERFSKIGSGAKLEEKNIVETVEGMVNYLRNRISKKVEFTFETCDADIRIAHNPSLFEWVVENICKNAVDAMEGRGKLHVSISKQKGKVYVDITDTGKGMTLKEQRNVFQPGFTTKKRGWGLGLSLVRRIIKDYHKGRVYVLKSELNVGTTFRISLGI